MKTFNSFSDIFALLSDLGSITGKQIPCLTSTSHIVHEIFSDICVIWNLMLIPLIRDVITVRIPLESLAHSKYSFRFLKFYVENYLFCYYFFTFKNRSKKYARNGCSHLHQSWQCFAFLSRNSFIKWFETSQNISQTINIWCWINR